MVYGSWSRGPPNHQSYVQRLKERENIRKAVAEHTRDPPHFTGQRGCRDVFDRGLRFDVHLPEIVVDHRLQPPRRRGTHRSDLCQVGQHTRPDGQIKKGRRMFDGLSCDCTIHRCRRRKRPQHVRENGGDGMGWGDSGVFVLTFFLLLFRFVVVVAIPLLLLLLLFQLPTCQRCRHESRGHQQRIEVIVIEKRDMVPR